MHQEPIANLPLSLRLSNNGVANLVFTRPAERNLIDAEFIECFRGHLRKLNDSTAIRCLILRADGPVFCGGGRIQWLQSLSRLPASDSLAQARSLVDLFAELNRFPAPVIAAVHGAAMGGAVALVAACDIVVAHQDAVFSLIEARLGLMPSCAAPFVIAKIGTSWARRLFITGERFSAAQALEIGLVHEVAADNPMLEAALERVLQNILACSPAAVRAAKRLIHDLSDRRHSADGFDCPDFVANALTEQLASPDARDGMAAFLDKRTPNWKQP